MSRGGERSSKHGRGGRRSLGGGECHEQRAGDLPGHPQGDRNGSGVCQQLALHFLGFWNTWGKGMDSRKLNLPYDAALHLFEKLQFCISPLFLAVGILSDMKHFL